MMNATPDRIGQSAGAAPDFRLGETHLRDHSREHFGPDGVRERAIVSALGTRPIVLVGIMGCGKSSAGRRLAARLGLAFADADAEIEAAHRMSIAEIFALHGEQYFRDGERRVMARLLSEGPRVLATGGGAFMNGATQERIRASAVSLWLRADFEIAMRRVRKRSTRPLLQTADPEGTLRKLIAERDPIYATADIAVASRDAPIEQVVEDIVNALHAHLCPPISNAQAIRTVPVAIGSRAYDILIGDGLIAEAGAHLVQLAPGAACAIVTDENVAAHHLGTLEQALDKAGMRHQTIRVPAGEASKSYAMFERVCEGIIGARIERGDLVIALGGGVIGDLAGFVASTVRRGVRFVQIPTSLLAQVDSSIGGKTAINSAHGKNLIGAFYQPALVLADTQVFATLPLREFRAGYAEVVKYGLLGDHAFFEWLEANRQKIFDGGPERAQAIVQSCAMKAAIVARDETERGERALLNLGHTFAHALERLTHYDGARLVHGEAVSVGLACAFRFSQRLGLCSGQDAMRVAAHLKAAGLPTRIDDIAGIGSNAAIVEAMHQDKKVQRGALTFILVNGIGQSHIAKGVLPEDVLAFLDADRATETFVS